MTCNTCKGFGYLVTAPSTCSAGGERMACPVCAPKAASEDYVTAPLPAGARFSDMVEQAQEDGKLEAVGTFEPKAASEDGGAVKWRERWYGSEPQRGSSIYDELGNLIAYLGGDEATHRLATQIVTAHNAALATSQTDAGAG